MNRDIAKSLEIMKSFQNVSYCNKSTNTKEQEIECPFCDGMKKIKQFTCSICSKQMTELKKDLKP